MLVVIGKQSDTRAQKEATPVIPSAADIEVNLLVQLPLLFLPLTEKSNRKAIRHKVKFAPFFKCPPWSLRFGLGFITVCVYLWEFYFSIK